MKNVKRFLQPDSRRLVLLAIFVGIAVGGKIQAWAFSDMPPRPPLYDLLEPLPIWSLWMVLISPLALLALPLRLVGIEIMGGPAWLFLTANLVYFYLLSCFVTVAVDWLRVKWKPHVR
jgi:hypothetical protein